MAGAATVDPNSSTSTDSSTSGGGVGGGGGGKNKGKNRAAKQKLLNAKLEHATALLAGAGIDTDAAFKALAAEANTSANNNQSRDNSGKNTGRNYDTRQRQPNLS